MCSCIYFKQVLVPSTECGTHIHIHVFDDFEKLPLSCCICCKDKVTWTTALVVSIHIAVIITSIIDN